MYSSLKSWSNKIPLCYKLYSNIRRLLQLGQRTKKSTFVINMDWRKKIYDLRFFYTNKTYIKKRHIKIRLWIKETNTLKGFLVIFRSNSKYMFLFTNENFRTGIGRQAGNNVWDPLVKQTCPFVDINEQPHTITAIRPPRLIQRQKQIHTH